MSDVQRQSQCAAETGTIYDDVFTGSTRRRHGLTAAGLGDQDWCHVTLTRMHAAAGGCQSEWTLDRRCSVDIITTLNQDGRGLAQHWCDCRPCSPHPRLPLRCMIGLPQGTRVRGSQYTDGRRCVLVTSTNASLWMPARYVCVARCRLCYICVSNLWRVCSKYSFR